MTIDETTLRMLTMIGLVLFGIGYNFLAGWLEKQDHGYTAFVVVGGVLVTLAGATVFTGVEPVLWVGLCFAATGISMVLGSMWRHLRRKRRRPAASPEDVEQALLEIKRAAEMLARREA